jgi:hypothetical protein
MTAARRLGAIVAANVAEYSRLITVDDEHTRNRSLQVTAHIARPSRRRTVATFRWEACLLLSNDRARVMVEQPNSSRRRICDDAQRVVGQWLLQHEGVRRSIIARRRCLALSAINCKQRRGGPFRGKMALAPPEGAASRVHHRAFVLRRGWGLNRRSGDLAAV